MTDPSITSRQNSLVRHARAVRERRVEDQIFIEGLRLAEEAYQAKLYIQDVLYNEKLGCDERGARLLDELRAGGVRLSLVADEVLSHVSDTKTPQGLVMLAARPHSDRVALEAAMRAHNSAMKDRGKDISSPPLIVIIHRINNPANAGAILRTAEAAGASAAIATTGTADLFSPKALRGSMGSGFRLPLWTGASFREALLWCKENSICTVGAALDAESEHTAYDWTRASAIVMGPEAEGLTALEAVALDATVKIRMRAPVESLNVAVACGVILYEAVRQRGN